MLNFVAFQRGHVRLSLWRFVIWALLLAVCLFPIFAAGGGRPKRKAAAGAPQAWHYLTVGAAAAAASLAAHRDKRQRTVSCDLAKPNTYQIKRNTFSRPCILLIHLWGR